jgi:predicted  nucleic acid-binding Zn-ribbon protein
MPHQCVKCGKFYDDGSEEILKGCPCGGRLFFYINKKKLEESKNIITDLTAQEKNEIEKDVLLKSYVWCCQANHTSPSDISCYINQSELDAYSVDMLSIPFQISLISLINVANLFLGERSSSEELKTKLENFKKNFLN